MILDLTSDKTQCSNMLYLIEYFSVNFWNTFLFYNLLLLSHFKAYYNNFENIIYNVVLIITESYEKMTS